MRRWWARWRVALRISRREALRTRGRSVLVVAMIALPVLGIGAADVIFRTYQLSPDEQATRNMGAADLTVSTTGSSAILQDATTGGYGYTGPGDTTDSQDPAVLPSQADVAALLPAGARLLGVDGDPTYGFFGNARIASADGARLARTNLSNLDWNDPLAAGIWAPVAGRGARAADEIALTEPLADRLGAGLGATVTLDDERRTVVGLVASTRDRGQQLALVAPSTDLTTGPQAQPSTRAWLVAVDGADWSTVQRLNASGLLVTSRTVLPGTPPRPSNDNGDIAQVVTAASLIAGMALLEIVLLAGPAFAVGAKRRERELALLSATGGDARDVRRVVLGSAVVLGAAAGVIGLVLGAAVARVAVGRLGSQLPGPFELRPLELGGVVAVALVVALLAAIVPARTAARQDPLAGLTGRRGTVAGRRWIPVAGLVAAGAGAVIAYLGASGRDVNVVLAGSVVAELGLVATTPFLVGLAGRLSPLLPVAPRMALRDAARNRGRTAPAVAAILAAVAGAVAVSTFVASQDAKDRAAYNPSAPAGTLIAQTGGPVTVAAGQTPSVPVELAKAVGPLSDGLLPVVSTDNYGGDGPSYYLEVVVPPANQCPLSLLQRQATAAELQTAASDARCGQLGYGNGGGYLPQVVVGDSDLVALVTGSDDPAVTAATRADRVVVPAQYLDASSMVTITVHPADDPDGTHGVEHRYPAVALPDGAFPATVLPLAVADDLGLPLTVVGAVGRATDAATQDAVDRAASRIDNGYLYLESGYHSGYGPGLLALLIGSGIIVLGASGIATGLAAADGRADLSTLAAIGATPGLRRRLAGFQSAVTAGLGTVLGAVAGLVPALALIRALNGGGTDPFGSTGVRYPLVVPWTNLLVLVFVVPALAALAAGLFTRSRLVVVRRAA